MSYEGYNEYLCKRGHHWSEQDLFFEEPSECPICKENSEWKHSVNTTNGFEEDNPSTHPAEKEEITPEYKDCVDDFGTKYKQRIICFAPTQDSCWHKITEV